MSILGGTFRNYWTVNGRKELRTANRLSGLTFQNELFEITGSAGTLAGSSAEGLTFDNSTVFLRSDISDGNNESAALNFGNRLGTVNKIRFINQSKIITQRFTGRKNIQLSELSDSSVTEGDRNQKMFVYMQNGCILNNCTLDGIRTLEMIGQPSVSFKLTLQNMQNAYLNWESPKIEHIGLAVINIARGHLWLGQGNGGNVEAVHHNNDDSFDDKKLYLTSANNKYRSTITASYKFVNKENLIAVRDVLVIYRDNRNGNVAELGRYISNNNGELFGKYDSRNFTNSTNEVRKTLFLLKRQVTNIVGNGSGQYPSPSINGDQGVRDRNYSIADVIPRLEIRSYDYIVDDGYSATDIFNISQEVGKLGADYEPSYQEPFKLLKDAKIKLLRSQALALTTVKTVSELYQLSKAKWRNIDNAPLLKWDSKTLDLQSYELKFTSATYNYTSTEIAINGVLAVDDDFNAIGGGNIYINSQNDADKLSGLLITSNAKLIVSMTDNATLELDNIKFDSQFHIESVNNLTIINKNGSNASIATDNVTIKSVIAITIKGLKVGTEIRVYNASDNSEIEGIESIETESWTFYSDASITHNIIVYSVVHDPIYIDNFNTSSDTSIPVSQNFSRNYKND